MRRKINISLLFASISFVLTLVFANVSWEFSDYKYSTSFLSVTSAAAAEEPVAQILLAQNDDEPACENGSNLRSCYVRGPEDIKIISPEHDSTVNILTSKISWKAVPEAKSYYVEIENRTSAQRKIVKEFTKGEFEPSSKGEIIINYSFDKLIPGDDYRLTVEAIMESGEKGKSGKATFKVAIENSKTSQN